MRLAVFLLLAMAVESSAAQGPTIVRGRIVVDNTSVPLADVHVASIGAERVTGALSGPDGRFAVSAGPGSVMLVAARMGFKPETVTVVNRADSLVIRLTEVPLMLTPQTVQATQSFSAASSSVVRQFDIAVRPRASSQELLRIVPGLVIAQHAGGGKAEQIFLRGFDADHGTDVAISVDGSPVNMVSHAHGQGYADLHYLLPEVVDHVDVRKGPFDARDGDFATAGAVAFVTKDRLDGSRADASVASFDTRQALLMAPFGGDEGKAGGYVAASGRFTDGPFHRPQDYGRWNGFAKFTAPISQSAEFVASAAGTTGRWDASGEIPSRAVAEGLIDRFGTIDSIEGGNTRRMDLSIGVRSRERGDREWNANLFGVRYNFQLFSDFTFFLRDSVNGDAIEQADSRTMLGGNASYGHELNLFGLAGRWRSGIDVRNDRGDIALYHERDRVRLSAKSDSRLDETSMGLWLKYDVDITSRLRVDIGARGDAYEFGVADLLGLAGVPIAPDASEAAGTVHQGVASFKANVAYDLTARTTLFLNAGSGFHSNDARDVVAAPAGTSTLPRAVSEELGVRTTWIGGSLAVSLWTLGLESELVWAGDEGTTEASGRTRRNGIDVEARARLLPWLWADADVNLSRGRFVDDPRGADLIPLAPTSTAMAGLTVRDSGPVTGGARVRFVGPRAANDDGSVRALGYAVTELFAAYTKGDARIVLAIDNALNVQWNEAQFATTSRLRGEAAPVTELNFTPGAPRTMQLRVELLLPRGRQRE